MARIETLADAVTLLARYVRCIDIPAYEQLGWLTTAYIYQRGDNYDCFICIWPCQCKPREPRMLLP